MSKTMSALIDHAIEEEIDEFERLQPEPLTPRLREMLRSVSRLLWGATPEQIDAFIARLDTLEAE